VPVGEIYVIVSGRSKTWLRQVGGGRVGVVGAPSLQLMVEGMFGCGVGWGNGENVELREMPWCHVSGCFRVSREEE
jgi:hypothetical protein